MNIWLLEDGERTGPHEIYEVRDRIANNELTSQTLAWYEGAEDWVKLEDVPTYASYFKKEDPIESLLNDTEFSGEHSRPDSDVFQNEPLEPVRRFFARFFDMWLYAVALYLIKIQMGINPFVMKDVIQEVLFHVPYFVLDGLALSYIGTTPGKWLLNIKLRAHDGRKLTLDVSLIRSLRVWILGFGMQSWFAVISLPLSWFVASKYGKFLWDIPRNNVTNCGNISPVKLLVYVALVIVAFSLLLNMTPREMIPPELLEEWSKILETKNKK